MTDAGFERTPPQDFHAEQAVLGGMMMSKEALTDVVEILNGTEFYRPAHATIFRAITDMFAKGETVDPITVSGYLAKSGDLVKVGDRPYLHTLVSAVPTAANAEYYAGIIREYAQLRSVIQVGTHLVQMGYAAEGDAAEIFDAANTELGAAAAARDDSRATAIGEDFEQYLDDLEAFQREGRSKGVPTGFTDLDSLTGGLLPGQMVIVAGRPAMGKSTLALDFARSCAIKHGRPAAFFSLEMSRREVQNRVMSAQARIALHHLRMQDGMTDEDWYRFAETTPRVTAAPLHIYETEQTLMSIKAKCRRLKQGEGLDLVVIDYLQLLTAGLSHRVENRQVEVATMSRGIKVMAKELGVPVVVLSQLNRGPEQRTDKKPTKSDLRESGALEQDADIVILLHREDAYEKESPRAGEADLIVDKHRNGSEATITVAFQGHYSRFVDMAQS
ncbi:replicative DNA helicase [Actinacidiphila oryziradicis]|uniref:Replicative DNA helicase n=2 Tax=Actinacidiphila oryziradicis TaxID=2571141 RepID=A0A4U0SUG3_9ACTN|nr:replicative DNA helicase [Actinacidiphila oryziradicis]TKA13198.1 replicative DNA helicase [Actinacidiphila oryziradicis]